MLDQWKEHKISGLTVAAKFNPYRFADHREQVIDLLRRVCTVSVETMKIVRAMPALLFPCALPSRGIASQVLERN